MADCLAHKVVQLGDQMRPVVRDRVARVVPVLLNGTHGVACGLPSFKKGTVGACREAVGMREDDGAMGGGLGHGVVAFGRHEGEVTPCRDKRYFQARRLV